MEKKAIKIKGWQRSVVDQYWYLPLRFEQLKGDNKKLKSWAKESQCFTSTGSHLLPKEYVDYVEKRLLQGRNRLSDFFPQTYKRNQDTLGIVKSSVSLDFVYKSSVSLDISINTIDFSIDTIDISIDTLDFFSKSSESLK